MTSAIRLVVRFRESLTARMSCIKALRRLTALFSRMHSCMVCVPLQRPRKTPKRERRGSAVFLVLLANPHVSGMPASNILAAQTSAAHIPHRRRRRTHRKAAQDEGEDYRRRTLLLGLLAAGNPLPHQLASGAKSRSETRRRVSRGGDLPLFHSAREKRSSSVVPGQPPPLLAF